MWYYLEREQNNNESRWIVISKGEEFLEVQLNMVCNDNQVSEKTVVCNVG
jgi:hypothetical protein